MKVKHKRLVFVSLSTIVLGVLYAAFALYPISKIHSPILSDDAIATSTLFLQHQPAKSKISFQVHIFFKDDLTKFERFWDSLNKSNPINSSMTIFIHAVQLKRKGKNWLQNRLNALTIRHAEIRHVKVYDKTRSIRDIVTGAWFPKSKTEYGIFLTYDTELSCQFLQHAEVAAMKYIYSANRTSIAAKVVGISLQNVQHNPVDNIKWSPAVEPGTPYLLQFPSSQGIVLAPVPWIKFRSWANSQPPSSLSLIPNSMTNRWNSESTWLKDFVKFMHVRGMVMLYLNFPTEFSLVKKQEDVLIKNSRLESIFLSDRNISLRSETSHPLSNLPIFNTYFKKVNSLDDLVHHNPESFDKCTIVMNTFDRVDTLLDRIKYYQTFPLVDRIVIVWNHQTLKPHFDVASSHSQQNTENSIMEGGKPEVTFTVPVHIKLQSNSSLNNRYIPFEEIRTDCVISMDDDFDVPHNHLAYR
ncbi:hypothetical protein HDU83_007640 [Entophlyctis luteolus]|nr:hypothetical protein HDU83_007640 [Entophlyctis luteolus]